jgi:hypothetical protein
MTVPKKNSQQIQEKLQEKSRIGSNPIPIHKELVQPTYPQRPLYTSSFRESEISTEQKISRQQAVPQHDVYKRPVTTLSNSRRHTPMVLWSIVYGSLVIVVVGIVWAGWAYIMAPSHQSTTAIPDEQTVRALVSELAVVPTTEAPTFIPIESQAELATLIQENPFYRDARVFDVILIYKDAALLVVYRSNEDKIVSIAHFEPEATTE